MRRQWSEELQLTMQRDALTGVVGFYYFDQESDDIVTVELNPPPPGVQLDSDNNAVDNDSWAVFTQWTYDFNDELCSRPAAATPRRRSGIPGSVRLRDTRREASAGAMVRGHVQRLHAVRIARIPMVGAGHGIRELRARLQRRRLEQPLQRRAHAAGAGGAAPVPAGRGRDVRGRRRSSISPATRCA